MSGSATVLALHREAREHRVLAHLLHALNQPLTGLQCSLELASSVPRSNEEHVRTMREAIVLTARMRVLVEALRELVHSSEMAGAISELLLNAELADCVGQLHPVAAARNVELQVANRDVLPVQADRKRVTAVLLRTIAATLSLCRQSSIIRIDAAAGSDSAQIIISWTPGPAPEFSPFSRPQLGLLIAQAAWESGGGRWTEPPEDSRHTCTLQLSMALSRPGSKKQIGDAK